jgi:thiol-disulfide isomerase/thioredoxin
MNLTHWIPFLALAVLLPAPAHAVETAVPFRTLAFDAAVQAATAEGKLVFIDFYTTWCEPCKRLDAATWSDPAVAKLLGEKTVPLKIDAEKEQDLAKRYKIEAYPTLLLLKPDGTEVDRLVGFREAPKFLEEFTAALAGKNSLARAQAAVVAAGGGDSVPSRDAVQARYNLGQTLAQRGDAEAALVEYLWCYDVGMVQVPSYVGVRSSFLLSSIAQLGRSHPPALVALRERRDRAEKRMTADATDRTAAMDFASLNNALGEGARTLAVFDQLAADDPRRAVLSSTLFDQLVEAQRYADAVLGSRVNTAAMILEDTATRKQQMMARLGEAGVKMMVQATVSNSAKVFEALAGAGHLDEARALADQILKVDASDETKTLLQTHATRAGHPELLTPPPAK